MAVVVIVEVQSAAAVVLEVVVRVMLHPQPVGLEIRHQPHQAKVITAVQDFIQTLAFQYHLVAEVELVG